LQFEVASLNNEKNKTRFCKVFVRNNIMHFLRIGDRR